MVDHPAARPFLGGAQRGRRALADQTGQVGNDQNQGGGKYDEARLPDLWLCKHGYLPIVLVGDATPVDPGRIGCGAWSRALAAPAKPGDDVFFLTRFLELLLQ